MSSRRRFYCKVHCSREAHLRKTRSSHGGKVCPIHQVRRPSPAWSSIPYAWLPAHAARIAEAERKVVTDLLTESIQYSLDHRPEAVEHALQYARDMGVELADQFVGMYVNHWTLDYGDKGRDTITRFLGRAHEAGLIPHRQELEFVS